MMDDAKIHPNDILVAFMIANAIVIRAIFIIVKLLSVVISSGECITIIKNRLLEKKFITAPLFA